jgi:hypothetical protein
MELPKAISVLTSSWRLSQISGDSWSSIPGTERPRETAWGSQSRIKVLYTAYRCSTWTTGVSVITKSHIEESYYQGAEDGRSKYIVPDLQAVRKYLSPDVVIQFQAAPDSVAVYPGPKVYRFPIMSILVLFKGLSIGKTHTYCGCTIHG